MRINPWVYRLTSLMAVLGLLALLLGLIVVLLLPSLRYAAWVILALGVGLLTTAFILDFRRVSRAIAGRRGRLGIGTTVMVSIFIGIILLVNAISLGNYKRFDVTALSQFTLSTQTKEVLSKLAVPVKALGFFVPGDPVGAYIKNLLTEYAYHTDKLSIDFIDPDEHPDQATKYGITQYESVVFESQYGRRLVLPQEIVSFSEQGNPIGLEGEHAFTSAILEVTGITQKKVYFLTGHGEGNINSDYSDAKESLLDNLYKVDTLDLLVTPSIPEDATALIIAAPQKALDKREVEIIENYLKNGGWVMILTNPSPPQEIKQLLSSWGADMEDGTIIDPSSYVSPSIDIPSVPRTRNFFGGLSTTYFPGAAAIIPQPGYTPQIVVTQEGMPSQIYWASANSQIRMYPLVRTSQDSWLEKNFNTNEKPEFNEGIDLKGPLNIGFLIITVPTEGAAGESATVESKMTRLIVFGDADFASNPHFYNGDNGNLFLNSIELLTTGKELISIERKVLPFRRLIVGPEATRFINYSSISLLPLLVLVLGSIIWWQRR